MLARTAPHRTAPHRTGGFDGRYGMGGQGADGMGGYGAANVQQQPPPRQVRAATGRLGRVMAY